jgi:hypothetical protein
MHPKSGGANMITIVILIAIFLAIVILMVSLRSATGGRWDIRNSDILLALIPIAFWLILSGKVKVIEFGGFKIESAFVQAVEASISPEVNKIPVDQVEMETKGGIGLIPRLIENKTEALVFYLGQGGYYGPAIGRYLRELTAFPFFKYIIMNNEDGSFFGLADARSLNALLISEESSAPYNLDDIAQWLNRKDYENLSRLPGFLGIEQAISQDEDKRSALGRMNAVGSETLPVVDDNGRFLGMVDRNRLTSSLIIDVAEKVM